MLNGICHCIVDARQNDKWHRWDLLKRPCSRGDSCKVWGAARRTQVAGPERRLRWRRTPERSVPNGTRYHSGRHTVPRAGCRSENPSELCAAPILCLVYISMFPLFECEWENEHYTLLWMSLFSEVIVDHMVIDNDNSDETVWVRDFLPYLVLRSTSYRMAS